MSKSEPRPVSIRRYEEADNAHLLTLLEKVFGVERTPEQWRWRFEQNPVQVETGHRQVYATLGIDETQETPVIAQYAVTPTFLNFAGMRLLGCQSGDTAVDPEYRGYGLFLTTALANYEMLEANEFKLVYGFPNLNSFPGFIRRLNWHRVFRLHEYSLKLRVGRVPLGPLVRARRARGAMSLSRRFKGRDLAFAVEDSVPEDFDSLWKEVSRYEVLSVWKDRAYLEWRYADNRSTNYRFYSLREDGKLLALAVATSIRETLRVTELLSAKKDVPLAQLLVQHLTRRTMGEPVHSITFTGRDDLFFESVFTGYARTASPLVFCLLEFDRDEVGSRARIPGNWTVTSGDLDYL
ncbi:MAG: GNAT family N-acetyltransferase [Gemmatimonadales bacterium]|nr:MAG: GNAT family N-acetyltransferase [Gemmatimonadales bacterium]